MTRLLSGVSTNAEEGEIVVFKLTKYNKTMTLRDAVHSLITILAYKSTGTRLTPDVHPSDLFRTGYRSLISSLRT